MAKWHSGCGEYIDLTMVTLELAENLVLCTTDGTEYESDHLIIKESLLTNFEAPEQDIKKRWKDTDWIQHTINLAREISHSRNPGIQKT
jgi:hypothetical protein